MVIDITVVGCCILLAIVVVFLCFQLAHKDILHRKERKDLMDRLFARDWFSYKHYSLLDKNPKSGYNRQNNENYMPDYNNVGE